MNYGMGYVLRYILCGVTFCVVFIVCMVWCIRSYRGQSSANLSNLSPSHGLHCSTNCSSAGPFHGVQPFRNTPLQWGSPAGSQLLPAELLQPGLLSPPLHSSTAPLATAPLEAEGGLPTGSQPPQRPTASLRRSRAGFGLPGATQSRLDTLQRAPQTG